MTDSNRSGNSGGRSGNSGGRSGRGGTCGGRSGRSGGRSGRSGRSDRSGRSGNSGGRSGRGGTCGSPSPSLVFCHSCACYCNHNESACREPQNLIKAYYNCPECKKSVSTEPIDDAIFVPSIPCTTCNYPMSYTDNTY